VTDVISRLHAIHERRRIAVCEQCDSRLFVDNSPSRAVFRKRSKGYECGLLFFIEKSIVDGRRMSQPPAVMTASVHCRESSIKAILLIVTTIAKVNKCLHHGEIVAATRGFHLKKAILTTITLIQVPF